MFQIGFNVINSAKSKSNVLKALNNNWRGTRTFLTDNYYCFEQWDKYLLSDIVKKVGTVNQFSITINDKLNNKGLVTPLDMDLLATKLIHVNNIQELEFIENIFISYRKTQSALYVRDSMHYSFARNYIDLNQSDRLLQILKLKYKYGLYLDSYTANMLMDYFIKQKDFKKAALAAHEIMLQENNENELAQAACLLTCMKYMQTGENDEEIKSEQNDGNEKKEKRLVYFLRKEYNDEHFDLNSIPKLCGKTIYFSSSNAKSADPTLTNNLKMYGLLLLGKYEKAINLFEDSIIKNSGKAYKFVIDTFKKTNENLIQNEDEAKKFSSSIEKWTNLEKIVDSNADKTLKKEINDAIAEIESYLDKVYKTQSSLDIEQQNKLFTKWNQEQEKELNDQIKNFLVDQKKKSVLQRLDDLEKQEEMLTFFDKRQEIIDAYYGKGFTTEYPADIPIEPQESMFKAKYERHFKPWPKYMNRPKSSYEISKTKASKLESLKKIYLSGKEQQIEVENAKNKA